ncbi:MAG: anthranilate synthase component 1 [Cognaticolwellia sp.]|jgi:anthranilate synthase component 1
MQSTTPDLATFRAHASEGAPAAIPVFREILADLDTPVSAFLRVGGPEKDHAFLLESVEGGEKWGRYSIIGLEPAFVLSAKGRHCKVIKDGFVTHREERNDPLRFVEEQLAAFRPVRIPGLPRFWGGAVGWLGYDAVRWWERLLPEHPAGHDAPSTLSLSVPRSLLIFDTLRQRILVVELVLTSPGVDAAVLYEGAIQRIEKRIAQLRGPAPARKTTRPRAGGLRSNMEEPEFQDKVRRIVEYIRSGDVIQCVLSQRFELDYEGAPFDLYRALRAVNPSPYMFFINDPEQLVVGASPEVMVRVEGDQVLVAPIAGTRKRGATEAEDLALEAELLADPKECAEHVMLVDLARNDVGRIAAAGTVQVPDLMHVERYSHVMHICSTVSGTLAPGKTAYDAVRATFPAGTLSGAPKVRAMEILDELEPCARGLYGGSVGYFGFDGNIDLCIAIRTAFRHSGTWHLQVGAGIVADSDPAVEFQETLSKAGGVLRALELAREGL